MNIGLIALAAGTAIAMLILVTARVRRHNPVDLGSVSHQWITEQRLGPGHGSQQ